MQQLNVFSSLYPPDVPNYVHIPIKDFTPPTIPQMRRFVRVVDDAKEQNKVNQREREREYWERRWGDDRERGREGERVSER